METTSINPTDIAVIVILLLSALLAFARGLVREVLSVGAWVGAAFSTLYLFPHVLPIVQQVVAKELIAKAVAGYAPSFDACARCGLEGPHRAFSPAEALRRWSRLLGRAPRSGHPLWT